MKVEELKKRKVSKVRTDVFGEFLGISNHFYPNIARNNHILIEIADKPIQSWPSVQLHCARSRRRRRHTVKTC